MLQVILEVIRCISDFQKPWASKTAGLRVKDTSRSLCYPVLYGHCLPSCQAEHQAPGLLAVTSRISRRRCFRNHPMLSSLSSLQENVPRVAISWPHKKENKTLEKSLCGAGIVVRGWQILKCLNIISWLISDVWTEPRQRKRYNDFARNLNYITD